ncbi:MAG: YetF domain-containing protein [Candidatus Methylomirabilis sp.]
MRPHRPPHHLDCGPARRDRQRRLAPRLGRPRRRDHHPRRELRCRWGRLPVQPRTPPPRATTDAPDPQRAHPPPESGRERITKDELLAALRRNRIIEPRQVRFAMLEENGGIGMIPSTAEGESDDEARNLSMILRHLQFAFSVAPPRSKGLAGAG